MPAHQENRQNQSYQSASEQTQLYNLSSDYVPPSLDNQASFSGPVPNISDWSHGSFPYTNGFEGWNHNQYEEPIVYGQDASLHLKLQSLPTLQNLVGQDLLPCFNHR